MTTQVPNRPELGMSFMRAGVLQEMKGREAKAFLETIDFIPEKPGDPVPEDVNAAMDAIEDLLDLTTCATKRILSSQLTRLAGIGSMTMQNAMVRRLVSIGINPLGIAFLAQLELGQVTITGGDHAGTVIEMRPNFRSACGQEITVSFVTPGVVWDGSDWDITVFDRLIPESSIHQVKGIPLEKVVSTILTDGMRLFISSAKVDEEIRSTTFALEEAGWRDMETVADDLPLRLLL